MLLTIPLEMVARFVYILARLGGMVIFVPFWSNPAVSVRVRIYLSLMLTLVAYPLVESTVAVDSLDIGVVTKNLIGELLIGFALGLVVRFVFAGIEFAGHMIGFELGVSIINAIDPQSPVRVPTVSAFLTFFASIVFLNLDVHHWCLRAVIDSFASVPAGHVHLSGAGLDLFLKLAGQIFAIGLQISAAVVVVLVITDIALGIVTRAAPQIQLLVISFPIKTLVGISTLGLALYFFPAAVERHLLKMEGDLYRLVNLFHG